MSKFLLVLFVAPMAFASLAQAADSAVLKSGKWECTLPQSSKYFKSKDPYILQIKQRGASASSQVATFTQADGKFLSAKNGDSAFLVESGDLLPVKRHGYMSAYRENADFTQFEWHVSVRLSEGTYEGDNFDCKAIGKPVLVVSKPVLFDCKTTQAIEDGKKNRIRFGLVHVNDPSEITLAQLTAEEDESQILVTPKDASMAALNENTTVSLRKDRIEIGGDSAGIFLVKLVLMKDSDYTEGYVRIEDLSGSDLGAYSPIQCTVKR